MDHPWFLVLVIFCLTLFAAVVGFASWEETRARRKAEKIAKRDATLPQSKNVSGEPQAAK